MSGWLAIRSSTEGDRYTTPAEPKDNWVAVIDAEMCQHQEDFFRVAKAALTFPDYFGFNWSAFDECLSDLLDLTEGGIGSAFGSQGGISASTVEVHFLQAELLLAQEPIGTMATLLSILGDSANMINDATAAIEQRVARLEVYMHCPEPARNPLLRRLSEAGMHPSDRIA
jgi:hypothetical protein